MKLFMVLLFLLIPSICFSAGSVLLSGVYQEEITNVSPTLSVIVDAAGYDDIMVDIVTDKGSTVAITPILSRQGSPILGEVSSYTIADGGDSTRIAYSRIMAPRVKITVTKTEAGDTSNFKFSVRGSK